MCVRWREPRRDRCYNYGTTSFDRPMAMVWGFLRGRAKFWVSTSRPEQMLDGYRELDRTIEVQALPLAPADARALAAALAHDARRENRYYHYHHFRDNCTTRLRDFIDRTTGGALSHEATGDYPTLRASARAGLAEMPALLYLGALLLGRALDHQPTPYEAMFLPRVLRDQVHAVLGAEPILVYQRRGPPNREDAADRWPLFELFAVLAAPLWLAHRRGRFVRLASWWAVLPSVAMALLVWGLVAVSSVPELRWNELALVLLPTDLALLLGPRGFRRGYARVRVLELLMISLAGAIGLLRQPIAPFVLIALAPAVVIAFGLGRRGARPSITPAASD
jgi:hypothetical protein